MFAPFLRTLGVRDTVGVEALVDFAGILEGLLEGVVVVDAGSFDDRRPATFGGIESFVGSDDPV